MKSKTLERTYKIIKPHIKTILIVSFLSLLIAGAEILKPYLIEIAIDDYLAKGISQNGLISVGALGIIYIALVIIGNLINFISTTTTNMMGEEVIYGMRNKLVPIFL